METFGTSMIPNSYCNLDDKDTICTTREGTTQGFALGLSEKEKETLVPNYFHLPILQASIKLGIEVKELRGLCRNIGFGNLLETNAYRSLAILVQA
jgi:hypothetical protein